MADVALTAALLLAVSHAAFKTVLFLGAGSVLHATGERNLDRLGGLAPTMPVTSIAFGVAALGAAALPVTSGFAAEWVLLQSLIHGDGASDQLVAVALPITVSVVALTAGLALLTFVKAYGIAFLARPRSEGAAHAHEAGAPMRAGHGASGARGGRAGPGARPGRRRPGRLGRRVGHRGRRGAGRLPARGVRAAEPRGAGPAGRGGRRARGRRRRCRRPAAPHAATSTWRGGAAGSG